MSSDIKLDGDTLTLEGNWAKVMCWDIHLDGPGRRISSSGQRRALVHDSGDALTINYNSDYPAGVRIKGAVDFAGNITAHGNITTQGSISVANDLSVGDDLTVTDDATIGGTLKVGGVSLATSGTRFKVADVYFEASALAVATPSTPSTPRPGRVPTPVPMQGSKRLVLKKDTVVVETYSPVVVVGSPSGPSSVFDLVAEIKALRTELNQLKAQVAALGGG
ncbi:MAG: hypothetical protein KC420_10700 [Myxococcales bacterium]|nr:hypothetical protein [Myxococcales bacterium]MCB9569613.1 hypothetical protein [Myxococcales bacterium]MCB9706503.1 hypothetical protein [Myxococcales bacterium]